MAHLAYRVTDRERKDYEYKKRVLRLAKEHKAAGEIEKVDRYYMPKDDVVSRSLHVVCCPSMLSVGRCLFLKRLSSFAFRARLLDVWYCWLSSTTA